MNIHRILSILAALLCGVGMLTLTACSTTDYTNPGIPEYGKTNTPVYKTSGSETSVGQTTRGPDITYRRYPAPGTVPPGTRPAPPSSSLPGYRPPTAPPPPAPNVADLPTAPSTPVRPPAPPAPPAPVTSGTGPELPKAPEVPEIVEIPEPKLPEITPPPEVIAPPAPIPPSPSAASGDFPFPDLTDDPTPTEPPADNRFVVPPPRVAMGTPRPAPVEPTLEIPRPVAPAPASAPATASRLPEIDEGPLDIIPPPPPPGPLTRNTPRPPAPAPLPPPPPPPSAPPAASNSPVAPASASASLRSLPGNSTLGQTGGRLSNTEEILARSVTSGLLGLNSSTLKGQVASDDQMGGGVKTMMVGDMPIFLHAVDGGWIGPRGERYETLPSQADISNRYK